MVMKIIFVKTTNMPSYFYKCKPDNVCVLLLSILRTILTISTHTQYTFCVPQTNLHSSSITRYQPKYHVFNVAEVPGLLQYKLVRFSVRPYSIRRLQLRLRLFLRVCYYGHPILQYTLTQKSSRSPNFNSDTGLLSKPNQPIQTPTSSPRQYS